MKNYLYLFLVSFAVLVSCNNDEVDEMSTRGVQLTSEDCVGIPRPADTYVFPVSPDTEKWKKLHDKGLEYVYEAHQMPSKVLKQTSTEGLIYTFFDYPYGITPLMQYFSSFASAHFTDPDYPMNFCMELQKRKDAAGCLVKMLGQVNPLGCNNAFRTYQTIMLMLTVPDILDQLDLAGKKELARIAIEKNEETGLELVYASSVNYLLSHIMLAADYEEFRNAVSSDAELKYFVETGPLMIQKETGLAIAECAKRFIESE